MDIEKLTKSQIVLLTLLVSFVTSIATGIVTVSLMDQAPPAVTQTINRVVERTVERVVPSETQAASVITEERTVVVKESDLIAEAIERITPSIIRIYRAAEEEGGEETLVALGTTVSDSYIITDMDAIDTSGAYVGKRASGAMFDLELAGEPASGVAVFEPRAGEEGEVPALSSATVNTDAVTLGQTVVAIAGVSQTRITEGIVTEVLTPTSEEQATSTEASASSDAQSFTANIPADALISGSTAVNTDGAVIGMYRSGSNTFLSADAIRDALSSLENATSSSGE